MVNMLLMISDLHHLKKIVLDLATILGKLRLISV